MKRLIPWLVNLLLIGGIALGVWWIAWTEAGLQWSVRMLESRVPGHLTIGQAHGRWIGPLALADLHYENDSVALGVERLALDWQPVRLLGGSMHVSDLSIEGIVVQVRKTETAATQRPSLPSIKLPLAFGFERVDVRRIRILATGHEPFVIDELTFSGIARGSEVRLAAFHAEGPSLSADVDGQIPLSDTGELSVHAAVKATFDGRDIAFSAAAVGTPRRAHVEGALAQPIGLHLQGEIDSRGEVPRWQMQATAEPFDLQKLVAGARAIRLDSGTIEAHGRGLDFGANLQVRLTDTAFGSWTVGADGHWDSERWQVARAVLQSADGATRIEASGEGSADIMKGRHRAEMRWQAVGWPIGSPKLRSPHGQLAISGSLDDYTIALDSELEPPATPPVQLAVHGRGDRRQTRLDEVEAKWLDGEWSGSGLLRWQPERSWELALGARNVDLGGIQPMLKSSLAANLHAVGALSGDFGFDLAVEHLNGELHDHPIDDASGVLAFHNGVAEVRDFALRSGDATLQAGVRLGGDWTSSWRLDAPRLSDLVPELSGSLHLTGQADRPQSRFHVRLDGQADQLAYRQVQADSLHVDADLDLADDGRWQLRARGRNTRIATTRLGDIELDGQGTTARHTIVLRSEGGDAGFEQRLSGAVVEGQWRGELHDGHFDHARLGSWQQTAPAALTAGAGALKLADYCFGQEAAVICLRGERNDAGLMQASLNWKSVDLAKSSLFLAPLIELDITGIADGSVSGRYEAGRIQEAAVELIARRGAVRYYVPNQENIHLLSYQSIRLSATAKADQGLHSDLEIAFSATEHLAANVALPGWDIGSLTVAPSQPVAGELELRLNDISAVSLFVPDLVPEKGSVQNRLTLSGTAGAPQIDGEVRLDVPVVSVPRLGTKLETVALIAKVNRNRLTLDGSAKLGDGKLNVDGDGAFDSLEQWNATIRVTGSNVDAIRLPSLQVTASPDVSFSFRPHDLAIEGRIEIPRAKLEPVTREATVSASTDVVVLGSQQSAPPEPPLRVHGSLEFVLGDDVKLTAKGVDGRLTGRLLVLFDVSGDVTGQGEIQLEDGRYRAYGQNLTIKQGRLLYAGGPLDNPALDVVASRTRGDQGEIEVGVRVTGTAKKPELELFSSPAMDESDILAYLVVGRPLNQVREGEGTKLYEAANSVALVGGEAVAERIAERFDLGEVSVEASDTQPNDTALVLGRAISPRLYLQYLQGISASSSALRLRYRLSKSWMLETESGTRTGAGGDLLYIYEH